MGRVNVTVGSALDIFGCNLAYKDVVAWHKELPKWLNLSVLPPTVTRMGMHFHQISL